MKRIASCRSALLAAAVSDSIPRNASLPATLCTAVVLAAAGLGIASNAGASTYFVTTAGDPGGGGTQSLRQAVALAQVSAGNIVAFDAALNGSTITLQQGQIKITKSMQIQGPGSSRLTISGQHNSRIFLVYNTAPNTTVQVDLDFISLTQGSTTGCGGAVYAIGLPDLPGGPAETSVFTYDLGLSGNSAQNGGALCFIGANGLVAHSRVTGNHGDLAGGAIYSAPADYLAVTESTLSGNSAGYQGGAIFFKNATLSVATSTISGNTIPAPSGAGDQGGGGIAIANASNTHIVNSTITANFAFAGGAGIRLFDGPSANTANIEFATIAGNVGHAFETGNGIVASGGSATIFSSIVANNSSSGAGYDDMKGTFTANNTLIRSVGSAIVTGSSNKVGLDPQLSLLADHGGPTLTLLPAIGSPVIDSAGVPAPSLDQRSFGRSSPDMGAVERQYPENIVFRDGFDST